VSPQCSQKEFDFGKHFRRRVTARFDGGPICSDGGAVLLREVDRRLRLIPRLAGCFADHRDPARTEHSVSELLAQRLYAIALGYEDLNDHDELRRDPLLALLAGKQDLHGQDRKRARDRGQALAGKTTLHRLERTTDGADRHKKIVCHFERVDELLVDLFVEASDQPPERVVLDLDVTDTPLHGEQEGRFFHGYYGHYCYLPLYIFAGEHLLCARQREANQDAAAGSLEEVKRIVAQIRRAWPQVQIIVRGDSGFCREELMAWCEENKVDYVFGLARNERLRTAIDEAMAQAAERQRATGEPARVFCEFQYQTRESWSQARRVVAKAEQLEDKENPRYVVTSLGAEQWPPQQLYEETYCARGEMENRIKEQLSLFADRMSSETMRANQLRLYISSLAYTLMLGLRRLGLPGTRWARAQSETIRRRLLKIGVRVKVSARRVWLSLAEGWPYQDEFEQIWRALRAPPLPTPTA
jgi:hypothetical protein